MRIQKDEIKQYLNNRIGLASDDWRYAAGANYGIKLQRLVRDYYKDNRISLNIQSIRLNANPNSHDPDILINYNDGNTEEIEVKSCKNGNLNGVTICNTPELINDRDTFLINYTFLNEILNVTDVIFTQLFRLITINQRGKYSGCLSSTRDTGKKIKGRSYNDFLSKEDENDYTLQELTNPDLIRRTVLYYTASKFVDNNYHFTDDEILQAINRFRLYNNHN